MLSPCEAIMNLFDIDWVEFTRFSTEWDRLSEDAKHALSNLVIIAGDVSAALGPYVPELIAAGFLVRYAGGRRVRLDKDRRAFLVTVQVLSYCTVLHEPAKQAMHNYLGDNFTFHQRRKFCPEGYNQYDVTNRLAGRVTSANWVEGFSSATHCKSWPPRRTDDASIFLNPRAFKTLQRVVRKFMSLSEPVAFKDLEDIFKTLSVEKLGAAIHAAIGSFLLFPGIRPDDGSPIIGLHPAVVLRLQCPVPKNPKSVKPDETYHGAPLMDDMTAVMVSLAARPVRVRASDGALFAKARKEIEASLVPPLDWLGVIINTPIEKRVKFALDVLRAMQFVENIGESGNDLSVRATDSGTEWLTTNAKTRLQAVLDHIRPQEAGISKQEASPSNFQDTFQEWDRYFPLPSFELVPNRIRIHGASGWDMTAELAETFKTLAGTRFVGLGDFLAWHSQQENPLLELPEDKRVFVAVGWSSHSYSAEQMETLWEKALLEFIFLRLVPLAGARIGRCGEVLSISLTDAGRYLLGLADDFDHGHEHDTDRVVVIQPNFDVVFMSPSPRAEASLASFAQRQGHGVGALFKITKKSILTAAAAGMSADNLLDTLNGISTKDVPPNVTREIRGWFDQCRRVTVSRAMLVRCPDAETAARVLSAAGKRATAITDTLIELEDTKANAALFRKLDGMAIFSDLPAPPAAKRRKKRRRRTHW